MPPAHDLPDDIQTLQRLLLEERAARQVDRAEIQSLKLQLAYLKRLQFGQSSEQLSEKIDQLELVLEDLEAATVSRPADVPEAPLREPNVRRPLPADLPREIKVHDASLSGACACPACGGCQW
jgi:hypothetical protein